MKGMRHQWKTTNKLAALPCHHQEMARDALVVIYEMIEDEWWAQDQRNDDDEDVAAAMRVLRRLRTALERVKE